MRYANRLLLFGIAAGLLCCLPDRLRAQDIAISRAAATEAGRLLNRAPQGPSRQNTLTQEAYVNEARRLTRWPIETVEEATDALERFASSYSVTAHVESVPSNLQVQYRRTYLDPAPNDPTVTTDNDESLEVPTYYVFRARSPYTGKSEEQTKNCLQGCRVKFVFHPRR
jgi:hypothetical protein